jgi:peroxiredoxin
MRTVAMFMSGVLGLGLCSAASAQDGGDEAKQDGQVEIDSKWIDRWKKQKIDVDRLLADLAETGIAKISATYARDMVADEPKARQAAMAALTALAMAGPDEQEGRSAVRVLERFGALKEERAGAPELFGDIAAKLPVGTRRTVAVGAWVRAWCALDKFDEAAAALASAREAYGKQAALLERFDETIRVARVRHGLRLGGTAPALTGAEFGGGPVDTAQWRGEVVVVWFWSRDSKRAVVRVPEMNGLAKEFGAKGVRFLGVAVDADAKAATQFAQDSGMEWPQLCEPGGYAAAPVRAWAVESVPRLWVVDRKGVVRAVDLAGRAKVAALLTTLLAEKTG